MSFIIGSTYDPMTHTLEENIQVLGRPLAEQIEILKTLPDLAKVAVVTKVDKITGVVTIESIDSTRESN